MYVCIRESDQDIIGPSSTLGLFDVKQLPEPMSYQHKDPSTEIYFNSFHY